MLLGDELYLGTNHTALAALPDGYTAVCALYPTEDAEAIRKNYTVALDDGRITALIEKPERPTTPYVGCGTYLFTPEIYRDAHETPRSSRTGRLELTEIIDHAARRGATVLPFVLAPTARCPRSSPFSSSSLMAAAYHRSRETMSPPSGPYRRRPADSRTSAKHDSP